MKTESLYQKQFFNSLKKYFKDDLVVKLTQLLGIKKSAAYNKINGTTQVTFDELYKIGNEFDISFDRIIHNNPFEKTPFSFYSDSLKKKPDSYMDFLRFTVIQLDSIQHVKNLSITAISPACSWCTYGFASPVVDPETNRLYISDRKEIFCYQLPW
jgi:hypothetical protein